VGEQTSKTPKANILFFYIKYLEFGQIDIKLFGRLVDASHLVDGLDGLGAHTQAHVAVELFREEALPLQIDVLDLLDAFVRKGDDAGLTVGSLTQQIADTCSHHHVALA